MWGLVLGLAQGSETLLLLSQSFLLGLLLLCTASLWFLGCRLCGMQTLTDPTLWPQMQSQAER